MTIAPIRTPDGYKAAIKLASELAKKDDQAARDKLDVLLALLEAYERGSADLPPPEPIEAIRFRMKQADLKPRDLEPYIGSRARVSEVLSGKRALTLDMIRALHRHLGIPASSLLADAGGAAIAEGVLPSKAALKKLVSLGFMGRDEHFSAYLSRAFHSRQPDPLLRQSRAMRANAKTDYAAVTAWCGAVLLRAKNIAVRKPKTVPKPFEAGRAIAKLSVFPDGPLRAGEFLAGLGIALVILEHLPGTYLDGAAILRSDGVPVVALTLRYDRIDNFWFTILHEICHALLHLQGETTLIIDDLELKGSDAIEDEADAFAQDALIPKSVWDSCVSPNLGIDGALKLAAVAQVHPAIVAGRWQREHNDYRRFSKMLGRGEIRMLFRV